MGIIVDIFEMLLGTLWDLGIIVNNKTENQVDEYHAEGYKEVIKISEENNNAIRL